MLIKDTSLAVVGPSYNHLAEIGCFAGEPWSYDEEKPSMAYFSEDKAPAGYG